MYACMRVCVCVCACVCVSMCVCVCVRVCVSFSGVMCVTDVIHCMTSERKVDLPNTRFGRNKNVRGLILIS